MDSFQGFKNPWQAPALVEASETAPETPGGFGLRISRQPTPPLKKKALMSTPD